MSAAIIVGTRPEAIKLMPLCLEFKKRNIDVALVFTGQHEEMVQQISSFFEVKEDINLHVMRRNQTLADLTATLITALNELFTKRSFSKIIVQGDTTTAFTAALTGFYHKIPVAHVEAGLRTNNKFSPYPEEINRQLISRIADWHFAPTHIAEKNLLEEHCSNVFVTGNTVIDSLLLCKQKVDANELTYSKKFQHILAYKKFVLITGHRRENFSSDVYSIIEAVKTLALNNPETGFYYPVHLSEKVQKPVHKILGNIKNVILDTPLPYDELVFVMSRSFLIMTDSGGIQEEAPSLNKPVIVLRDTTERPEGIESGCAVLAGTEKENIIHHFNQITANAALYQSMASAVNPYGDGTSCRQIVDILESD